MRIELTEDEARAIIAQAHPGELPADAQRHIEVVAQRLLDVDPALSGQSFEPERHVPANASRRWAHA